MDDTTRIPITLNGREFQLVIKPWPYKVGRRWLTRIVKLLGGLAGAGSADAIGIDTLLERVDDAFLEELVVCCEEQTAVVGADGAAIPFAKLSPLLAGRYDVTLRLTAAHLRVTFGPFFASLGGVLSDLTGDSAAGEAATDGGI